MIKLLTAGSRNFRFSFAFLILFFISPLPAFAVSITINPGNLTYPYLVAGVAGWNFGTKTFDLSESATHNIAFGAQNGIKFHVDAAGNITTDTTRASVVGNEINFITKPINIDPGLFDMTYRLGGYTRGVRAINVVGAGTGSDDYGSRWQLNLGDQPNGFFYYVDENGVVTTNSSRFIVSGTNTITFTTIPIVIDPERFDMTYNFIGKYRTGLQTIHLVPGGTGSDDYGTIYKAVFGDQPHGFTFHMDETGFITTDSTKVTVTNGNTFTFNTVPVHIDTQLFELDYNMTGGRHRIGSQTIYMVAEGTGTMDFGNRIKMVMAARSNGAHFNIDTNGNLSTDSSRFSIVGGNTIAFDNTIPIDFDPGTYTNTYNVTGVWFSGPQTINLIPAGTGTDDFNHGGLELYATGNRSSAIYQLESPCAILPSETIIVGTGENAIPFILSCPDLIVDTDGDGVADTSDNCPAIANADQIDQDVDGIGNACDEDLDGDQVPNSQDNCPNIENADQLDLNGDGEGDACDNDTDGDSVPTNVDNCPLTPNTAQQDNDSDGLGDACDTDDDNDTVSDELDNCPNQSNTDQNDSDADGQGDVCDGDIDGDGVGNDSDLCSGTASGLSVTTEGCSGSQHIELSCVKNDFPNHGKYVSCVSHAANDAVDQGLITKQEKSRFVSQAAKSK